MMAGVPRPVDIKKKANNMGYSCQNLRVYDAAGEGPQFAFNNKTQFHVRIDFLDQNLVRDTASGNLLPRLSLAPGKSSEPLTVNVDLGHGTYQYKVVIEEADIEAEGGSRPGIEIVP